MTTQDAGTGEYRHRSYRYNAAHLRACHENGRKAYEEGLAMTDHGYDIPESATGRQRCTPQLYAWTDGWLERRDEVEGV